MKAYQLKVAIKNSKPPIWRRCIVPAGISFSQLTIILRVVMGWSGSHLSEYQFSSLRLCLQERYDFDNVGWDGSRLDSAEYIIDEFLEAVKSFTYVYDFGDWWAHEIKIEKIIEDYEYNYPVVTKFKGDSLVEDCGGILGYYDLLNILANKDHPEYKEMKEWYDEMYPGKYDLTKVNNTLSKMTVTKKKIKPTSEMEYNNTYLGNGYIKLDKVNGKTLSDAPGKGFREDLPRAAALLKELINKLDSNFDEEKLVQLLDKDNESNDFYSIVFDKWDSVQIEQSRNLMQDHMLNHKEKDINNYCKYLQLPVDIKASKLSKIKALLECLSEHPEYYYYIFDKRTSKVLFEIYDGKADALGFCKEKDVSDDVGSAIDLAVMLGLLQVKDDKNKCILKLATDSRDVVEKIRQVDAEKIFGRLKAFDKKLAAIIRSYGFIEVDEAIDMIRDSTDIRISTKEYKIMLYWHSRMNDYVTTGYNKFTTQSFIIAPGLDANAIMLYRFDHKISDILDYRPIDFNDRATYSDNLAETFFCWNNLCNILTDYYGMDEQTVSECVTDIYFDTVAGKSGAYLYDRLKELLPKKDAFLLSKVWHAAFSCAFEMGLPHLKGYSRDEYIQKTGKLPKDLPIGEKLPKKTSIDQNTELRYFPEEDQIKLYFLQVVDNLMENKEESAAIAEDLLARYPDNKYLLAYLPDVFMALGQKDKAKEVLNKLRIMDHSVQKEVKKMLQIIDSNLQLPYFEDEDYDAFEYYDHQETVRRENPKIGRNDPCPCGSGKKFKKCCMGKGIYD